MIPTVATIPEQLQSDMDSLEEKFEVLVSRCLQIIKECEVDMDTFKHCLSSLSFRNKIQHKAFLKFILPKIRSKKTSGQYVVFTGLS